MMSHVTSTVKMKRGWMKKF